VNPPGIPETRVQGYAQDGQGRRIEQLVLYAQA